MELKSAAENLDLYTTQEAKNINLPNLQTKTATDKKTESPWQQVSYRTRKRQHSNVIKMPENSVVEEEYNCSECPFQGTTKNELEKHIKIKHRITCRICEESFKSKPEMMVHRKLSHPSLVATCKNYASNACPFSDLKCWWNHNSNQAYPQEIKCFACDEKFENKPSMMVHRKKKHPEIVRQCAQFEQMNCRFQSEFCWFKHEVTKQSEELNDTQSSVFQKVLVNPKPPIIAQKSALKAL